jgi:signal transduction histidine kinase
MGDFFNYLKEHAFEASMLIQNIVTVTNIIILFKLDKKEKHNILLLHFFALLWILVILNGIWELLFHVRGSYFLTHLLLFVGYAEFLGKLKNKPSIISIILFYSLEVCIITFSSTFPHVLTDYLYGDTIEIFLRNSIVILSLAVAFFFHKYNIRKFNNTPSISVIYSAVIGTATTTLSIFYCSTYLFMNLFGNIFAMMAFFCILAINFVAYYLDYAVYQYNDIQRRLMVEKYMAQNDRDMLQLRQQNLEDIRKISHDIKNQYAYLGILLEEHRYNEMEKYFSQIQENIVKPLSYIDCGNKIISAILNLELAKAHSQGIKLDCRVLVSQELPFMESDLCSLLTNLIDNAIEACVRFAISEAVVEVGINQKQSTLYICVVNPVDETIEKDRLLSLETTKGDSSLHGYGLKIVEGIVNKYNGHINRLMDKRKYIVDIMLDMMWEKSDID